MLFWIFIIFLLIIPYFILESMLLCNNNKEQQIKHCTIAIVLFLLTGVVLSMILLYRKEDMTGIMMRAMIRMFASSTIATFVAVLIASYKI